jgi:hypothetical protein
MSTDGVSLEYNSRHVGVVHLNPVNNGTSPLMISTQKTKPEFNRAVEPNENGKTPSSPRDYQPEPIVSGSLPPALDVLKKVVHRTISEVGPGQPNPSRVAVGLLYFEQLI